MTEIGRALPRLILLMAFITLIPLAFASEGLTCTFEKVHRATLTKDVYVCVIEKQNNDDRDTKILMTNGTADEMKKTDVFSVSNQTEFKFIPVNLMEAFPKILVVEIIGCGLEEVSKNDLTTLVKLREIDLRANMIKAIEEGAFDGLIELELLYLNDNQISSLNENIFGSLAMLKKLKLDDNRLSNLDSMLFSSLGNLEILGLKGNGIKTLDANIFSKLEQLILIVLSLNELETLEDGLFRSNKKLSSISLDHNKLKYVSPTMLEDKPRLRVISFANNTCVDSLYFKSSFDKLIEDLEANCTDSVAIQPLLMTSI